MKIKTFSSYPPSSRNVPAGPGVNVGQFRLNLVAEQLPDFQEGMGLGDTRKAEIEGFKFRREWRVP
jgi:hypothetical protein